jgi:hypothetical protein
VDDWEGQVQLYKASFGEFTDVCGLDYHTMKEGEQMDMLPKVKKKSEVAQLYVTSDFVFGKIKGLAMEPSVLNTMLHCSLLPRLVTLMLSIKSTTWPSRAS